MLHAEIQLKPVANGRVRKTSRGAEMFFKRQAEQGIKTDPGTCPNPTAWLDLHANTH